MDWPVGTLDERAAAVDGLPGAWLNANPFLNRYRIGDKGADTLHTGADLNLNKPYWNADWHRALYAMDWGYVVDQERRGGSWGHILVIWHWDALTNKPYLCRYGHLENARVVTGQMVTPGQLVGQVGDGDGFYAGVGAHLHWDICTTDLLRRVPWEWPGLDAVLLLANYVDPIQFVIKRKRMQVTNPDTTTAFFALLDTLPDDTEITILPGIPPLRDPTMTTMAYVLTAKDLRRPTTPNPPPPATTARTMYCTAEDGLKVRQAPVTGTQIGSLAYGEAADVIDSGTAGWLKILSVQNYGGFVSASWMSDTAPNV